MAQSIFEILDTLKTTTSVPGHGAEVAHSLPRNLFPTSEQFEDASKLLAWANENGYTHALLQQGIQKGLIDCRAKFKAVKKTDEWSISYGQSNVNGHRWEITNRPNSGGSKKITQAIMDVGVKIASAMKMAGLDEDTILATLTETYGFETAGTILDSIK